MDLRKFGIFSFAFWGFCPGALAAGRRPCSPLNNDTNGLITSTNETVTLTSTDSPAVAVLDYGRVIEGIPSFDVVGVEGDTSVFEISYAESLAALDNYMVKSLRISHSGPALLIDVV